MCFQDWRIREAESKEEQKRSAGVVQVGAALYPTRPVRVQLSSAAYFMCFCS